MLYDPLARVLANLQWWAFWLIYSVLDIIVNLLFCFSYGGKRRVKIFLSDSLSILWPFFVLGPIAGAYLYITESNVETIVHLQKMKVNYANYSISLQQNTHLFIIVAILSLGLAISTRMRYEKYRPDIWFSNPKTFGRVRTILFDFPMAYMGIMAIIKLVYQWIVLRNFLSSSWLPVLPFHVDGLYGINWVYKRIIGQIVLALIVSISPLVMIIREGKQKYSWIYKTLFSLGIASITIATFLLARALDQKISSIYTHFVSTYIASLQEVQASAHDTNTTHLLQQILLTEQMTEATTLPNKLNIPPWLASLISIRIAIFLALEVYTKLADRFSWTKIPVDVKKILEKLV